MQPFGEAFARINGYKDDDEVKETKPAAAVDPPVPEAEAKQSAGSEKGSASGA